jgi:hypothetical protein
VSRTIEFVLDDFDEAFSKAGIDPATLTDYEWCKFQDAFLAGCGWVEAAEIAADTIAERRRDE